MLGHLQAQWCHTPLHICRLMSRHHSLTSETMNSPEWNWWIMIPEILVLIFKPVFIVLFDVSFLFFCAIICVSFHFNCLIQTESLISEFTHLFQNVSLYVSYVLCRMQDLPFYTFYTKHGFLIKMVCNATFSDDLIPLWVRGPQC